MAARVLIAAGGTGGHIFPALAVAHALKQKNIQVIWLGSKNGLEAKIIPQYNIPLFFITVYGLRGKGIKRLLYAPFFLFLATVQSIKLISQQKPFAVIGMGGFTCGPAGIAARLMHKKLILHEQNAILGLTNKILANFTPYLFSGFPLKNSIYIGNPVRKEIISIAPPLERYKNSATTKILIVGGSQGAHIFNAVIPLAIGKCKEQKKFSIWHQTGKSDFLATKQAYAAYHIDARATAFIDNMDNAYAWADLVICRAGAMTVAEIAACGIAAIFVPFPGAVDNHQEANANFLCAQNAAILIKQNEFTVDKLTQLLLSSATELPNLQLLAQKAWQLRKIDATEKLAHEILNHE